MAISLNRVRAVMEATLTAMRDQWQLAVIHEHAPQLPTDTVGTGIGFLEMNEIPFDPNQDGAGLQSIGLKPTFRASMMKRFPASGRLLTTKIDQAESLIAAISANKTQFGGARYNLLTVETADTEIEQSGEKIYFLAVEFEALITEDL